MTLRFDFTERTVIVTGGAKGIGRAIADAFLHAGAHVSVWDPGVSADSPTEPRWQGQQVDVADPEQVDRAMSSVVEWTGRVDIVVNNAGIARDAVVWKMDDADWRDVIGVHLSGTFHVTRAAVPHMRDAGWGRVINVTSYTGMHGNVGQANYAAAKGGIIGFTKSVAKEGARFGITANSISPNAMTDMVAAVPPDRLQAMTAEIPLGRFADAAEIAPGVLFLASEEAAYITGAVLPVDGGVSM